MTLSVNNLGSSRQIMSEEGPSDLAEDSQLEDERLESEELERKILEKQAKLLQLQSEVKQKKESLAEVVENRRALAEVWTKVLVARNRVNLMRQVYAANKSSIKKEYEAMKLLRRNNDRREDRLKRVRTKNFRKKEEEVEVEYAESCAQARQVAAKLHSMRRDFITQASSTIFPIEVEALSQQDAGEEDYVESSIIDCDSQMEVDGGWVLGGMHKLPAPNIRIVTALAPSDGDYSLYLKAAKERRKAYAETAQRGVHPPFKSSEVTDPCLDPYFTVPAAMTFTAQFVELMADTLDQTLPYPLPRHTIISEYGSPDRKKKRFLDSVAKLDDNILYLCFSQHVPLTALTPGHTLKNLLTLVTHTQLGRSGPFECDPELTRFRGSNIVALVQDTDSEPPSISYTTDQLSGCHSDSDSEEEEEGNAMRLSTGTDSIEEEWESMGPMPPGEGESEHVASFHLSAEMESRRERMRRLDYDSTYLDYRAMAASGASDRSVQLSATDSVRLVGSIEKSEGEQRGGGGEGGLFGTLSSLWTSTFSRSKH